MRSKKRVIIKDVYTNMCFPMESIYEANKWFYEKKISKNEKCYANIYNSLRKKSVIFKHYLVIEDNENLYRS